MKKRIIILLTLVTVLCCALCACNTTNTVTFNAQNGSEPIVVEFNEQFKMPTDPTNGEKEFRGWYTDKDCTSGNEWTAPKALTENITVYAKWVDIYTLTFDAQNGSEPTTARYNSSFKMPKDPTYGDKVFRGWYTDKDCTSGNEWSSPDQLDKDTTLYAKWHTHDYADNYILFVECTDPDCTVVGRYNSTDSAKEKFVYTFDETVKGNLDADYNKLIANLTAGSNFSEFENLFEIFDEDVSHVVEQYQYAYVFYCTYNEESYKVAYDFVSEYYNEMVSRYYGLFRTIYESPYKDSFFEGWTEEDIREALILSDSYGNSDYKEIKDQIDKLILEYDELMDKKASAKTIAEKYGELVKLNNQLASIAGYENYMEYAYASEYDRDYTPADVAAMRSNVKTQIVPVLTKIMKFFDTFEFASSKDVNYIYYNSVTGASVFRTVKNSQTASNFMGNYFKEMKLENGNQTIDFFETANKLFKEGNYYKGHEDGAYSYWIPNQETSILYFSNNVSNGSYSYQNIFTIVHEFGHYYNGVYNNGISLSMDHKETQSQGDEMMFLAWLANNSPSNITTGYKAVMNEQIANILSTIVVATAVDEFEQAAYTGLYNGKPVPTYANSTEVDYNKLFKMVIADYGGALTGYDTYWTYVVFDQAGYYISYAMSALPSVELYVNAMTDFEAAKASYFKLFTFSDNTAFVETDEDGYKTVTATYEQILNYCGLKGPFQDELYTTISGYFK